MGLFSFFLDEGVARAPAANAPHYAFLEHLPVAAWKKIISQSEFIEFRPGQIIIRAGEQDDAFYILSSGVVNVVVAEGGHDNVLATIPEGSVFGEIAFFDRRPRSATVRAQTTGTAIRIAHEHFDRLSHKDPALASEVLFELGRVLAHRLRWTTKLVKEDKA